VLPRPSLARPPSPSNRQPLSPVLILGLLPTPCSVCIVLHGFHGSSTSFRALDSQTHPICAKSHPCCKSLNISTLTTVQLIYKARSLSSHSIGQILHRCNQETQLVSLASKLSSSYYRATLCINTAIDQSVSICPSHTCIVSKRLNISLDFFSTRQPHHSSF